MLQKQDCTTKLSQLSINAPIHVESRDSWYLLNLRSYPESICTSISFGELPLPPLLQARWNSSVRAPTASHMPGS